MVESGQIEVKLTTFKVRLITFKVNLTTFNHFVIKLTISSLNYMYEKVDLADIIDNSLYSDIITCKDNKELHACKICPFRIFNKLLFLAIK